MALVLKDRVKETTTSTGTGSYALGNSVSGFQDFSVIGDGNTTFYCCTDRTDFEVGLGTYSSSGNTLARTTILATSNGGDAINWSAGDKDIFVTQPSNKAVYLDASGHIETSDGRNLTNVNATTLDSIDSASFLRSDTADTKTSGNLTLSDGVHLNIGSGNDIRIQHSDSTSLIDSQTVDLKIRQMANDKDIILQSDNGAGGLDDYIRLDGSTGQVILYASGSVKAFTTSAGLQMSGSNKFFGGLTGTASNASKLNNQSASYYLDYTNFTNTPTIPTNNNELTNGAGYLTSVPAQTFASLTGKPTTLSGYGITDAFDGAYSSLTGTPTIPSNTSDLTNDSGFLTSADGGNAQTLDGLDSTQFLRSNAQDDKTSGTLRFTDNVQAAFGSSFDMKLYHDSENSYITNKTGHLYIGANADGDVGGNLYLRAKVNENDTSIILNDDDRIDYYVNGSLRMQMYGVINYSYADLRLQGTAYDLVYDKGVYTTTLTSTNPASQSQTITLPDATGTVLLTDGDGSSLTGVTTSTLNGQNASYYLNYNNFTNTPSIPTAVSELTNDSGFITSVPAQSFSSLTGKPTTIAGYGITDAFDGAYSSLTGTPTIPSNTNQLTNGAGYITSADGGNAQTLDSLDSTQFLRSDAADTKTSGNLYFSDNVKAIFGAGSDLQIYHDATNSYIDQNDATLFIRNTSDAGNASGVAIDIRNEDNTGIEIPNNSGVLIKRSGNTDVSFAGTGAFFNTDIVLNGATKEIKWRDTSSGNYYLTLDAEQLTGSDKTITLPNVTGTVLTTANSDTPTTTTSSSDADFVLIDDGGVMKKITPANLGVGSGGGSSGISNVVEDTTPQLGGDLDLNSNAIEHNGQGVIAGVQHSGKASVRFYSDNTEQGRTTGDGLQSMGGFEVRARAGNGAGDLYLGVTSNALNFERGIFNLRNTGTQSEIRMYCESSNAHYAALKAPAHADFSGNVTLTLPATTSTLLSTASNLADLANVASTAPTTNQVLSWNGSAWTPADASGGGGGSATNADTVDNLHLSVVTSMPGSPDSSTIYFVTG